MKTSLFIAALLLMQAAGAQELQANASNVQAI